MTDTVIARRYASALFNLSRKEGDESLANHGIYLQELGQMVAEEPKFGLLLKSPIIDVQEKKAVLSGILDKLGADRTMRNFCFLLADNERLGSLREIADWYGILLDEANGILRGQVVTAVKLDEAKREEIRERLKKKLDHDIELRFRVDPEILGGMVLSVGDKVLDSSLRAQLKILRENLKRGI